MAAKQKIEVQEYCAGFLFSPFKNKVALILKAKPKWQAGKYNAIGGHIEKGETPLAAMRREFEEEAGIVIKKWKQYAILQGEGFRIYWFFACDPLISKVKSITKEEVEVFDTADDKLPANMLNNVRWLMEMAMAHDQENADSFVITEVAA